MRTDYQADLFDGRRKRHNKALVALESEEQESLFQWAAIAARRYPELALLHAIPNGGYRHKTTAAAMKAQGLLPGVPDICLPVARGGHHGLYIELKRREGGRLSQAQESMIDALREQGYRVLICRGWIDAKSCILNYLSREARFPRRFGPES